MKERIKKIVIFDMDGTLLKTPDKEECELVWPEKFGKPWPYNGVFSKSESLDFKIFDIPVIPHIFEEYKKIENDETIYKVVLTGRLIKLKNEVINLLNDKHLYFDEYLLNNRGETLTFKLFELERLSEEFVNVEEIIFFDDRDEHIPHFIEKGKKIENERVKNTPNFKFTMIHVK